MSALPHVTSQPTRRWEIAGLVLWSLFLVAASCMVTLNVAQSRLDAALASRPPVAVINSTKYVQAHAVGDSDATRLAKGIASYHAALDKLKAAGFIVIDANAVPTSPDGVLVKTGGAE